MQCQDCPSHRSCLTSPHRHIASITHITTSPDVRFPPWLSFRDIRKSFGAVTALDGVSFDVAEGEAHALVGENGAGKSTLLKILAGLVRPDAGAIYWDGERLELALAARRARARHRHGLSGDAELSRISASAPTSSPAASCARSAGCASARCARARASFSTSCTCAIEPDALAESLPAAHRQLLQVARALAFKCRILVLDEPTTALTDAEADHLFAVLRGLQRDGTTLLYVSHRLPEVFRLCDRITVLRDGRLRHDCRPRGRAAGGHRAGHGRSRSAVSIGQAGRRGTDCTASPRAASADASAVLRGRLAAGRRAARSSGCSAWWARGAQSCSKRSSACIVPPPARS